MNQISAERVKELLDSGKLDLLPTQTAINLPIIKRICSKLQYGIHIDNIRVVGNIISNGHHRYICFKLLEIEVGIDDWTLNHSDVTYRWEDVQINELEIETPEMIEYHNIRDSEYNSVPIDILRNL